VKVRNALSEETNIMRPLLYPSLLQVIQRNLNRGVSRVRIFELARIFESRDRGEVPCERWVLGGAISGKTGEDGWIDRFRDVGFFDIIGIIKRLFQELGIRGYLFESGYNTSFHPKNFIEIMVEEKKIGFAGEVHPAIISSQGLQPVFLFELDWDLVKELSNPKRTYIPIPKYPPIYRDIAIIVKDEVPSGKIYQQILDTGGHLIDSIKLFDVYHGPQIPKGHKSLAYSITYKRSSSTLTDDEVNPVHAEIIRVLCDRFGARLR
jgi:phenylalanyl-tRNA synthetase beta chain